MLDLYANPLKGFTTNPTLMRAAGISDFEAFAREMLAAIVAIEQCGALKLR
jgi:transaldolase